MKKIENKLYMKEKEGVNRIILLCCNEIQTNICLYFWQAILSVAAFSTVVLVAGGGLLYPVIDLMFLWIVGTPLIGPSLGFDGIFDKDSTLALFNVLYCIGIVFYLLAGFAVVSIGALVGIMVLCGTIAKLLSRFIFGSRSASTNTSVLGQYLKSKLSGVCLEIKFYKDDEELKELTKN